MVEDILLFVKQIDTRQGDNSKKPLREAGRELLCFAHGDFDDGDLSAGKNGGPFFKNSSIRFNISHSGSAAALIYTKKNNLHVGCDIELLRDNSYFRTIPRRAFYGNEQSILRGINGTTPKISIFSRFGR
jgi:phosphopantetheinyl transferase